MTLIFFRVSSCVELRRINLSRNYLQNLEFLTYNKGLTFLDVSENQIASLNDVRHLNKLTGMFLIKKSYFFLKILIFFSLVLNAGLNKIPDLGPINRLSNLNALILNKNSIRSVPNLSSLKFLNTLSL